MKPRDPSDRRDVRNRMVRTLAFVLTLAAGGISTAEGGVIVTSVRVWTAPDHTRVVLDLTGPAPYEVRRVHDPERIAINIPGARFEQTDTIAVDDRVLHRIRRHQDGLRGQVVLDCVGDARWRHFPLQAAAGLPDRIVVDVFHEAPRPPAVESAASAWAAASEHSAESDDIVVVLDPGHGGLDPGAIRDGVREKDVVLGVARELKALLETHPGYRVVLTRDGDYFVRLADRVSRAKEAGGDLFVSIHANSHERSSLSGMEVYFLARSRADDHEAQVLADRENASDLVGLAPEEYDDDAVLEILVDLRSSRVLTSSNRLADQILGAARRSGIVSARAVKQEVFRVLQSLAMPSSLVEVAYLTNDGDRALLATAAGRRQVAGILETGILRYIGETASEEPASESPWTTRYRIRGGDTLWMLARRHRTTVEEIRRRNALTSDVLAVGQQLTLP